MRPRSLPVLGPAIGLNLPQATTLPTHTFVSHILKPIFGCCCDLFDGSALCLCRPHKLRTKARDGTWHVESQSVKRKRTVQDEERLLVQDKDSGVRANRRCSTLILELECCCQAGTRMAAAFASESPFFSPNAADRVM